MTGVSLNVPGLLFAAPAGGSDLSVLHMGQAVGWAAHQGIHTWSREVSVVLRADLEPDLLRELGATLPEDHPEASRLSRARRAAQSSQLVAVDGRLVDKLAAKNVRVHTVGADRITGGFYYLAHGGAALPVRFQANLIEMIAPSLDEKSDNVAIEEKLDGIVGRVLSRMADPALSEAAIELAAALPALGEAASDGAAKLQELEGRLVLAEGRAAKYEARARAIVEALGAATSRGDERVRIPLFGEAKRLVQPPIEIEYADGDAGERKRMTLPERSRWFVSGDIVDEDGTRAPEKAAADKAATERAAADEAAAEKAAAEKAAAEKAAAEKAAAEKAAAEKAAAEKKAAPEKKKAEAKPSEEKPARDATPKKKAAQKAGERKGTSDRPKGAAAQAKGKQAASKKAPPQQASSPSAMWAVLIAIVAFAGVAYYYFGVLHAH